MPRPGYQVEGLMAALGHKTPKIALHYCNLANQRRMNDEAVVKWESRARPRPVAAARRSGR